MRQDIRGVLIVKHGIDVLGAKEAMDEYAINFAFWVTKYYFRKSEEDLWFNGCDLLGEEPWTTAQLLEEYKNRGI